VVDAELPETEYQVVVDEIRRLLHNVGSLNQLGRSFSWVATRSASSRRDLEVAVSVRGGRTRITIHENLGPLIGAMYGGIAGGMGGGGMGPIISLFAALHILPGPALAFVIPLWLATTFVTARTFFHRSTARREQEAALADRLAATVRELAPERPALRPSGRSGRT
jgi:hypothetical protein